MIVLNLYHVIGYWFQKNTYKVKTMNMNFTFIFRTYDALICVC